MVQRLTRCIWSVLTLPLQKRTRAALTEHLYHPRFHGSILIPALYQSLAPTTSNTSNSNFLLIEFEFLGPYDDDDVLQSYRVEGARVVPIAEMEAWAKRLGAAPALSFIEQYKGMVRTSPKSKVSMGVFATTEGGHGFGETGSWMAIQQPRPAVEAALKHLGGGNWVENLKQGFNKLAEEVQGVSWEQLDLRRTRLTR